jgi:hypothetical protein
VSFKRQRLREKIGDVPSSGKMPQQELALRDSVDQPVQPHVASFGQLGLDGLVGDADSDFVVAMQECASAAGGSQGRWSVRVWRSVIAVLAAPKVPNHSASWTLEQTMGMRVEAIEIGALTKDGSPGMPRWWKSPATLPAWGRERYDASDMTWRIMLDGRITFTPLRWAER